MVQCNNTYRMHEFLMASNFPTPTPTIHPEKGKKEKEKKKSKP